MANINYTATADLKSFSTWLTNNVDQNASTWDSGTGEGVLVLNSGVTEIGANAFQNCTTLLTIEFPNGITSIGQQAFSACYGLTSVTLPESLTSIGVEAFYGSNHLDNFTIPEAVTTLKRNSFIGTGWWNSQSNGIIYKDGWCLGYKGSKPAGSINIQNNTKSICDNAFSDCTGLTSVTLPESLMNIYYMSFSGCTSLTSVTLPDAIKTIGYSAFEGCTSLTSVTLPESLTTLGQQAFYSCTNLTTVYWNAINCTWGWNSFNNTNVSKVIFGNSVITVPGSCFRTLSGLTEVIFGNSVTTIGGGAFENCTGLTSITLPESLTTIEANVFRGCTGLTSITLPDNVTSIGNSAFMGCTNLTTIYWNAIHINSINGTFRGCTSLTSIICGDSVEYFPSYAFSLSSITEVIFGNSLKTIGSYSFQLTSLTSITLPASLIEIGISTFNRCDNLKTVVCKATTPPTLGTNNFTASDDTLYVPSASKATYEANTAWRNTFTNIKGIYTVTTSAGDNGTITPTTEVLEGESFTVTATPNAHYKVSHFVVDGVDVGTVDNYTFQNLDADHTIHVDFELITHTITATAFEGGAIVPSGAITVNEGENQSFDIIPLEGYGILAVFIDGTQIEPVETYTFTDVEADHTIQAMFYPLRVAGFNRDEMLDIDYILQDYLEQLKKRD